jgi:hypothetical protein
VAEREKLRRTLAEEGLGLREHGYGLLLILILVSLGFQLAVPEGDLAHVITIMLQGGTFIAALWTSQARTRQLRLGTAVVLVITVGSAIAFAASGQVDETGARIVSLLLVLLAPVVILHGILRHFREEGRVTLQTMFGVLCIYLLIGSLFAFTYGVIGELDSAPFFAQQEGGNTSDFLYFSFVTQTTTGYGDLTAATDLGRALAITEALIGQIYMVTVVAVIVGNLRRSASATAPQARRAP